LLFESGQTLTRLPAAGSRGNRIPHDWLVNPKSSIGAVLTKCASPAHICRPDSKRQAADEPSARPGIPKSFRSKYRHSVIGSSSDSRNRSARWTEKQQQHYLLRRSRDRGSPTSRPVLARCGNQLLSNRKFPGVTGTPAPAFVNSHFRDTRHRGT
jgi:hypothetical protein